MDAHDVYVVSFVAQGSTVLLSYVLYWPSENLWAGLRDPCVFYIWCVSALASVVGFCGFSGYLLAQTDKTEPAYVMGALPYSVFLFSAALYMPLATGGYKVATLLSLLVASLSTCALVACSVILYGLSWVTVLMGALAFHCTVIDLVFWGFTWTVSS